MRVLVDGVEQDRFVASRPDTLARALRPIGAYLERRSGRIEIVGVETSPWPFRRVTRTPLVPVLDDATVYLLGGP